MQHLRPAPMPAIQHEIDLIVAEAGRIILGKERAIRLAFTCLLAQGHLLIEDLPGVGKTTMAQTLAHILGLDYRRIQFTSDLLPADILGVSVYDKDTSSFSFHPGPIFANVILADEVNRATPRTQSALLEAMEERRATVEGRTLDLPRPFFVIATQNPSHQIGTFPLPESQLDRFMMKLTLGYPDADAEYRLLKGKDRRALLKDIPHCLDQEVLLSYQSKVGNVHISDALLRYLQDLLAFSRSSDLFSAGLSPRAGLAIRDAARAWALIHGRASVIPEDIQAVLGAVVGHRLRPGSVASVADDEALAEALRRSVPIP
jgi:MoxR-like ATPase